MIGKGAVSGVNERYLRQHAGDLILYFVRLGRMSPQDAKSFEEADGDVLELVAHMDGLDPLAQRGETAERAASIIEEVHAERASAAGPSARRYADETRAEAAERTERERSRMVHNKKRDIRWSQKVEHMERAKVYGEELSRLGRDPKLGLLTDDEFDRALEAWPEERLRRKTEAERRRLEEEERERRRKAEEGRRRDQRRKREAELQREVNAPYADRAWALSWAIAMAVGIAVFGWLGWMREGWPVGAFGVPTTGERVALHLLPGGIAGTATVAAVLPITRSAFGRMVGSTWTRWASPYFLIPLAVFGVVLACGATAACVYAGPEIYAIATDVLGSVVDAVVMTAKVLFYLAFCLLLLLVGFGLWVVFGQR